MVCVNHKIREIGAFVPEADDQMLVCRCEEVTKGEIRRAVHEGMLTMEEMRRFLRNGMGLCQGQTCERLVRSIMAKELKISVRELDGAVSRAPMRPVEMEVMGRDGGNAV